MTKNMGSLDRALRAAVGIVLALVGLFGNLSSGWTVAAYVVAALMLVTSAVAFCPAYPLLRLNTLGRKQSGSPKAA